MAEHNTWKKKEDLENTRELVDEFEERLKVEVRKQEGIDQRWRLKLNLRADEFKRSELPEKFTAKLLFE